MNQNRFVVLIFFLIVIGSLFWLILTGGKGKPSPTTSSSKVSSVSNSDKMEVSPDKLEEAWESAKKMFAPPQHPMPTPPGNMPISNLPPGKTPPSPPPMMMKMMQAYQKELGSKNAQVVVYAFLPAESCQGPTFQILQKLAQKYPQKLFVRILPLFGPPSGKLGLHCATIFINGKNYVTVEGKEIVFTSTVTHNVNLVQKAVEGKIKEVYGSL